MPRVADQRRAVLAGAQAALRAGEADTLRSPEFRARLAAVTPKQPARWEDMPGRAVQSLRDWLAHGFPRPMMATVREIEAALALAEG